MAEIIMNLRLIKERDMTGEHWKIYELTVPYSPHIILKYWEKDGFPDLDMPISVVLT